jgi:predicted ATPase/class 3 adenylate cyclase
MAQLPVGAVTFLFTDIEGSTRLLADADTDYAALFEEHHRLIRRAVERHGGTIFGTEGDAAFAAFARAGAALNAAAEMQRALLEHPWPAGRQVRVRAGIHSGEVSRTDRGYVGMALHEVARITAAGHGGQVLASGTTRELAADTRLSGVALRDLGEHRLKDVAHPMRLYQLIGERLPDAFPPLRTLTDAADNLPPPLTSFIGRDEVAEGMRLLSGTRLLTLTGPGGTGKTRLALELAGAVRDEFPGGVVFVALDAIRDPELVPSAIATALELPAVAGTVTPPLQRVAEHLRDRSALLVLDNFEQVVDAAPMVAQLLREAPRVKVVATSRIPLRLSGEQEFSIPPLSLPPPGTRSAEDALRSEAVALFVDRARAARSDFGLDDHNAAAVVDIVQRLDGLPLAIELAAARLRVLPVETLRERLHRRLAVLTGGARDLPARQQTLRGTIEWSYELLEATDRDLFERFGVFASAACLAEAEPICGPSEELGTEVLDGLVSLSEKSLLRPVPLAIEEPRFGMLATIREYAADRLAGRAEADAVRRRHAETYLALVEASAPHLFGERAKLLLDRLEQDHDNVRLALEWAVERGETNLALRFVTSVWRFWQMRGHVDEGWERTERILGMPGVADQPTALQARALGAAGSLAYWRGDGASTYARYRSALELARDAGERATLAEALLNFGFMPDPTLSPTGGLDGLGRPYLEEALALYRELGDKHGVASVAWALGGLYQRTGELDAARAVIEESLTVAGEIGDRFAAGYATFGLGLVDYFVGDRVAALRRFAAALDTFGAVGDVTGVCTVLIGVAAALRELGARDDSWRVAGACHTLSQQAGARIDPEDLRMGSVKRPTGDSAAGSLWDEGAAMALEQAVRYAEEAASRVLAGHPQPTAGSGRSRLSGDGG